MKQEKPTLTIYGDGEHDDTEAIQAFIDGITNVIHPDGTPLTWFSFKDRRYKVASQIVFKSSQLRTCDKCKHGSPAETDCMGTKRIYCHAPLPSWVTTNNLLYGFGAAENCKLFDTRVEVHKP